MMLRPIIKAAALLGAALMLSGQANSNWNAVIAETAEGGHRIGNPAAKVKLVRRFVGELSQRRQLHALALR